VTFTIVTCAVNAAIAEIHDRMPVVLSDRAAEDWMNPREQDPLSLKRLLVPAPADLLEIRPASPLVNSVKNEGRALLEYELFRIRYRIAAMRKVRLAHYALGLHGLAVLRNWLRGDEIVAARVRELREFAATLDENPRNVEFELHDRDVTSGYAAWSATYDEPVNPLVSLEQPIVRSFIDALPPGRALDAACGTGRHTEYLCARLRHNRRRRHVRDARAGTCESSRRRLRGGRSRVT
jgi:hypothetical protein